MRDLYRKLKIEPSATPEEISAAIDQQPDMKASSAILLDAEKRELYDSIHATLKMIAALRFRLDLDKGESWFIQKYPDFAIMPKPALGESKRQEAPAAQPRHAKRRSRKNYAWVLPLVILLLVAAAVGAMLLL